MKNEAFKLMIEDAKLSGQDIQEVDITLEGLRLATAPEPESSEKAVDPDKIKKGERLGRVSFPKDWL